MNENIDPNDVVKRALLMMKYDSNKTLTENKHIILERGGCANSISKEEFLDLAKETIEELVSIEKVFVRMFNQVESAQLIYDNVKYISKYNVYDDLDGTCKNGIAELKRNFKHYYSSWFRATISFSDTLIGKLKENSKGYYEDVPEVKRYLDATIKILENPPKVGGGENKVSSDELLRRAKACGHNSVDSYKKSGWKCKKSETNKTEIINPRINKSKYKQCNSFPYTKYCKGPVISEIQKCLGITVDSYFGPETDNALFKQYGTHSVTQSIYDQIKAKCGGTPTNTTQVITPIVNNDNLLEPTPSTDEV